MKIGITIDLKTGLFSSGVNQNAIFVANLIKEIGYDVYLIHNKEESLEDFKGIKLVSIQESFSISFDMLIQLGFAMHQWIMNKYLANNPKVKLIAYECGNKLIMDMESMLFKDSDSFVVLDRAIPDQIWSIPQMENIMDYYCFLNKQENSTVVPFVWEPLAIHDLMEEKGSGVYTKRDIKRIGVFEPNMSVMKNILHPIVSLEKYYSTNKDIESVVLFSTEKLKKNNTFIDITHMMELAKDRKLFVNPRITIVSALNSLVDVVFSWQWENNLNYLWIDAAWMGWPVIHNGSLCQDIGYYYKGFDSNGAVDQLKKVIEFHNDDHLYLEKNRKVIERYTSKNTILKEQYAKLITDALNGHFTKYSYDWKTNSIS